MKESEEVDKETIKKNAKNLSRRKFYSIPGSKVKWLVLRAERLDDRLFMLARNGKDFVVFTFSLKHDTRTQVPSDKYVSWPEDAGLLLFSEIISKAASE